MTAALDNVSLNFSREGLLILNACLAFVVFGVALNLKLADFRRISARPASFFIGVFSQLFLLPLITFVILMIIKPHPSIALGMFMVAACPGGSMSNFISLLSRANVALSVSLTAFVSTVAVFFTPLNFFLWSGLYAGTSEIVAGFRVDMVQMILTILLVLGLPLALGMWFAKRFPETTSQIIPLIRKISTLLLFGFIAVAFAANFGLFLDHFNDIFFLVLLHNSCAFLAAYVLAALTRRSADDKRAITIETGIQNASLGLVLVFNYFQQLGGMALVVAWWGVWHLVAGMLLAFWWSGR